MEDDGGAKKVDLDEEVLIPDEHFSSVGKCIQPWAHLEFEIDRAVWELLGVAQPIGACVTAQLVSVIPKLNALNALAILHGAKNASEAISSFSGDIGGSNAKRNRLVHDARFISIVTRNVNRFEIIAKNKMTFGNVTETISDLSKFEESTKTFLRTFISICDNLRLEIASLDKSPELPDSIHRLRRDQ